MPNKPTDKLNIINSSARSTREEVSVDDAVPSSEGSSNGGRAVAVMAMGTTDNQINSNGSSNNDAANPSDCFAATDAPHNKRKFSALEGNDEKE